MRSADQMATLIKNDITSDSSAVQKLQAAPDAYLQEKADAAKEATTPAYVSDKLVYRIVVAALAAALLIAIAGAVGLAFDGKTVPSVLVAVGSAALGALAGIFTPSPSAKASGK